MQIVADSGFAAKRAGAGAPRFHCKSLQIVADSAETRAGGEMTKTNDAAMQHIVVNNNENTMAASPAYDAPEVRSIWIREIKQPGLGKCDATRTIKETIG